MAAVGLVVSLLLMVFCIGSGIAESQVARNNAPTLSQIFDTSLAGRLVYEVLSTYERLHNQISIAYYTGAAGFALASAACYRLSRRTSASVPVAPVSFGGRQAASADRMVTGRYPVAAAAYAPTTVCPGCAEDVAATSVSCPLCRTPIRSASSGAATPSTTAPSAPAPAVFPPSSRAGAAVAAGQSAQGVRDSAWRVSRSAHASIASGDIVVLDRRGDTLYATSSTAEACFDARTAQVHAERDSLSILEGSCIILTLAAMGSQNPGQEISRLGLA